MPEASRTAAGRAAEDLALAYLEGRRLILVERNFRSRFGEIDLIMRDANRIVFVEVRSRTSGAFLDPVESIGPAKRERLLKTCWAFMQKTPDADEYDWRFDVVTLTGRGRDRTIEWLQDAFQAPEG